jgi:hypothetical protein
VVVGVEVGYQTWEFVFARLTYFSALGLYLTFSALALYLAIEGWRHADLSFPRLQEDGVPEKVLAYSRAIQRHAIAHRSQ